MPNIIIHNFFQSKVENFTKKVFILDSIPHGINVGKNCHVLKRRRAKGFTFLTDTIITSIREIKVYAQEDCVILQNPYEIIQMKQYCKQLVVDDGFDNITDFFKHHNKGYDDPFKTFNKYLITFKYHKKFDLKNKYSVSIDQGLEVFNEIDSYLKNANTCVTIDFKNVKDCLMAFLQSSYGRLYIKYHQDFDDRFQIVNTTARMDERLLDVKNNIIQNYL